MAHIKYFGTDGIRGKAGELLTVDLVQQAAWEFTRAASLNGRFKPRGRPVVVLAGDSRLSTPMLMSAAISGFTAGGVDVTDLGMVPTPLVPLMINESGAAGGLMVTASHNPVEDNGLKFFGPDARKIPSKVEAGIERGLNSGKRIGTNTELHYGITTRLDPHPDYLRFLHTRLRRPKFTRLHVALDCAFGATAKLAPDVFRDYGFRITCIGDRFDGSRINVKCGATDIGAVKRLVRRCNADFGLAFDGDGDRVLAVDSDGKSVNGDKLIALFATRLPRYKQQAGVVMTKMSNMAIEQALADSGITMHRTEVGDVNVAREMLASGLNLGGEQSGHIIMADKLPSGDGILAGLQLALILNSSKKTLGELVAGFDEFPQHLTNLTIRDKIAWQKDREFKKRLAGIKSGFKDVRFYLRPSGTENLVRVLTEAEDRKRSHTANTMVCEAFNEWSSQGA